MVVVCRHVVLKYGKPNAKRRTVSRAQRIEQLKHMYRSGMEIDTGPCGMPEPREEREGEESRGEGEGTDEVDQLLQWTQNLDDQVLNTTPNHLQNVDDQILNT